MIVLTEYYPIFLFTFRQIFLTIFLNLSSLHYHVEDMNLGIKSNVYDAHSKRRVSDIFFSAQYYVTD